MLRPVLNKRFYIILLSTARASAEKFPGEGATEKKNEKYQKD